jgi:hypothetical protein
MIDDTENLAGLTFSFLGFLEAVANELPATIEVRNCQVAAGLS